ncbi:hypothetical protein OKW41_006267 [Paraburkholderia sp. UCT70]
MRSSTPSAAFLRVKCAVPWYVRFGARAGPTEDWNERSVPPHNNGADRFWRPSRALPKIRCSLFRADAGLPTHLPCCPYVPLDHHHGCLQHRQQPRVFVTNEVNSV